MKAQFRCDNDACERRSIVVNVEVLLDGDRYQVYGDDDCGTCGKRMEPVMSARDLAAKHRSE